MAGAAALVALAAAMLYASAAALEHQAARREPDRAAFDPRLLLILLRRRRWLAGAGADLGGAGLQGLALALGPLALVQPILVGSLIMALPIQAAIARRRVQRHELVAVIVSGAGLAALILITAPGHGTSPPSLALAVATLGVAAVVLLLVLLAGRTVGAARAVLLGVATGALHGLLAALAKAILIRFAEDARSVLLGWELYALMVVGILAIALNQNAFQAGRLAWSLTGITVMDPVVSTTIGVTAFNESLALGGFRTVAAIVAAVVAVWGIWLVSSAWATRR
jgi:hypothetical protein